LLFDLLEYLNIGLEAELEMADDLIYGFRIFDKRDDSHLASTGRTMQRIHFVDLADHPGPAFGGHKRLLFGINTSPFSLIFTAFLYKSNDQIYLSI
jgi:hypothetical protein